MEDSFFTTDGELSCLLGLLSFPSFLPSFLPLFLSLCLSLSPPSSHFHLVSIFPTFYYEKFPHTVRVGELYYKLLHTYHLHSTVNVWLYFIPLSIHPFIHVIFGTFQSKLQMPVHFPIHLSASLFILRDAWYFIGGWTIVPLAKEHIGFFSISVLSA